MSVDKANLNNICAKPQIHLVGTVLNRTSSGNADFISFFERVDHAKSPIATSSNNITGTTDLDKENLLTFDARVRVIITGQMEPKPVYARNLLGGLGSLQFEGNYRYNTGSLTSTGAPDAVDEFAETYYTINGKEPVRTRARFYNYRDMDDLSTNNPSDPAMTVIEPESLGFVIYSSPTGSDLITVKAKTYYRGLESRVAVATFKIAQPQGSRTFSNTDL